MKKNQILNHVSLVIGTNQTTKSKLIQKLITTNGIYFKRYGRIIYIGQKKYKNSEIVQQEDNWIQKVKYQQIMDRLDQAKKDNIKNVILIFYDKQLSKFNDIIEKIIGVRNNYIQGTISFILIYKDIDEVSSTILRAITDMYIYQTNYAERIQKMFNLQKLQQIQLKKRRQYIKIKKNYKSIQQ